MRVESIEPENGRYAADLVFVHGLWTTREIWRPAALGFAHRGWRCDLLDLRCDGAATNLEDWCGAVAAHLESLPAPAILIGHDAGALVALALGMRGLPRAVVASAPLLSGVSGVHPRLPVWIAKLRGTDLPPPLPGHEMLAVASAKGQARLAHALVPDPARLVASVSGPAIRPGRVQVPTLLVGYTRDSIAKRHLVEITAQGIGADFIAREAGHYAMLEEPWDAWMSEIQRWIIRRGGDALVQLEGDEDLDPDAMF
ncbi:MAG: alpha/beta hydrolase [Deltaproteobacteria bacterium]